MKTKRRLTQWLAPLALALLNSQFTLLFAQPTTAFTYQGQLTVNGIGVNGLYDLRFELFDAASGVGSQGGPVTISAVPVTGGLFTVTLDLNNTPFASGLDRWLEISSRTNLGVFGTLVPRQQITSTPYAITARNVTGTVPASQISGTLSSAQIADGAIVDADISPSAAIADAKLATISTAGKVADTALSANVTKLGQTIESAEITDGTIVNGDIADGTVTDTKLATISANGKVANSATTAASANTPSAIVARDASGNFSAGAVRAGVGSSAAPSLSFTSDSDTGIFDASDGVLAFAAQGTERMRLDSAGLAIGTGGAQAATKLHVVGGSAPTLSGGGYIVAGATNGANLAIGNNHIMARNNGGTATLLLNGSGGSVAIGTLVNGGLGVGRFPATNELEVEGNASKTVAGGWLANSDARIKTEVHTVTHALEKLEQVRPVEFRYTEEYRAQHPGIDDRPYLNVIAQEFQRVFPEAVKSSGDKLPNGDGILQVDTYPLTIYSAAAIQELNHKLQQKDTEIRELRASMAELKALVVKGAAPAR